MDKVLYRHQQHAQLLGWFFALLTLSVLMATLVFPETPHLPVLALLFLASLLFYAFTALTVEVDVERVQVSFGLGFLANAFDVRDIVSCQRVRVPLWQGFGLRVSSDGSRWLYRIRGDGGVQLQLGSG